MKVHKQPMRCSWENVSCFSVKTVPLVPAVLLIRQTEAATPGAREDSCPGVPRHRISALVLRGREFYRCQGESEVRWQPRGWQLALWVSTLGLMPLIRCGLVPLDLLDIASFCSRQNLSHHFSTLILFHPLLVVWTCYPLQTILPPAPVPCGHQRQSLNNLCTKFPQPKQRHLPAQENFIHSFSWISAQLAPSPLLHFHSNLICVCMFFSNQFI